jgi:hypothetical protein
MKRDIISFALGILLTLNILFIWTMFNRISLLERNLNGIVQFINRQVQQPASLPKGQ